MSDPIARLNAALEGRYSVERELGEGGMATVYLAKDVRHDRNVAIKVLKPELAAIVGAERFLAEIRTTANLQHPHILPLHDSGESDGLVFYVMPYVEGESLRERLHRDRELPVAEAVQITRAVASALDYAHRNEVVHRDIKPANILLHDGQPMVADFGVALAVSAGGGHRLTETGVSVGTTTYMSPEQATGDRVVDARSDVYSLACVTYEMLAGEPPHTGSSAQAIMAKVLTQTPVRLVEARPSVPPHVEAAVLKALSRLPADRFATAGEFAQALVEPGWVSPGEGPSASLVAGGWRDRWAPGLAAGLVASLALAAWGWLRTPDLDAPVPAMAAVVGAADPEFGVGVGISPDGATVVFPAFENGRRLLFLRPAGDLEATAIPGTEGGHDPTFSPDGNWLAFKVRNQLKKVRIEGGVVTTLLEAGVAPNGGLTWGPDDRLYYPGCCPEISIFRVASSGGAPERVTSSERPEEHWAPDFLPGGEHAVFTLLEENDPHIAVLSMETLEWSVISEEPAILPRFVPPDRLVYLRSEGRQLMSVGFDPESISFADDPVPITAVDLYYHSLAQPQFRTSESGALVYVPPALSALVLLSKDGGATRIGGGQGAFQNAVLAPDERRVAVRSDGDVWIYDLERGVGDVLTNDEFVGWQTGFWGEDGGTFVYAAMGEGIASRALDGSRARELLFETQAYVEPKAFLSATELLVNRNDTLLVVDLARPDDPPRVLPSAGWVRWGLSMSPDGRWLAYTSVPEAGDGFSTQVWIQAYPGPGPRVRASEGSGGSPKWSADGGRLYYRSLADDGTISLRSVEVRTTPELEVGREVVEWENMIAADARICFWCADVFTGGEQAIAIQRVEPGQVVLIQDWREWLRRRTGGD